MLPAPALEHVLDLHVELGPIMELGQGRAGVRRIIPIIGGRAAGPQFSGRILNLGADWQTVFHHGPADLNTRYAIETEDGAIIEVINLGTRHGPVDVLRRLSAGEDVSSDEYYMRTHARLETGDARYAWVNDTLFVGTGSRQASAVQISLYKIC